MSGTPWRVGERYELLSQIAVSASCAVWRGRDTVGAVECAVRVLRPELVADPAAVEQMRQTLGTVAALGHPGIVAVGEIVVQEGWVALVSRFVPGPSLRALLDGQGRLPTEQATAMAAQVSSALAAAHAVEVAHGNLTATQVLIDANPPDRGQAVLTDFGLAALINHAAGHGVHHFVPTARYRAPELRPGDPGTPAADMFAVGALLYEALAGCHPFEISQEGDAVLVRRSEPDPIAGLPAGLWHLITGCLAPNPINRPTAATVARLLTGPTLTSPIAPAARTTVPAAVPPPHPAAAIAATAVQPPPASAAPLPPGQDNPTVFMPVIRPGSSLIAVPGAAGNQDSDEAPHGHGGKRASRMRGRIVLSGLALSAVAVAAVFAFTGVQPGGSNTSTGTTIPVLVPSGQGGQAAGSGAASATTSRSARASASASRSASASKSASGTAAASGAPAASASASASPSSAPISPLGGATSTTAGSGTTLANAASGNCLDTQNGSFANGTTIQLWSCGASGENWTLAAGGALTQDGGAYCLDDYNYTNSPGARVVLWSCNGGVNQQWTVRSDGTLQNVYSKLCLDVAGNGTANGALIQQSTCGQAASQRWSWR